MLVPFLLLPAIVAVFWAIMMFYKKGGSGAHRVMGIGMSVYTVAYLLFCTLFAPWSGMAVSLVYMVASLSVSPLHFLFFKKAVDIDSDASALYWVFAINAIVVISLLVLTVIAGPDMSHAFYHRVVMGEKIEVPDQYLQAPIWHIMDFICFKIFGLLLGLYAILLLVWAFVKMVSYDHLLDEYFSGNEGVEKKNNLLVFLAMIFTFVPIVLLLARPFYLIRDNFSIIAVCVPLSALTVFLVGLYSYRIDFTAEQLRFMIDEDNEKRKLADDIPVNDAAASGIIYNETMKRLEKAINDKVYLEPDLTLIALSDRLATNRTYLSKVINLNYNCTFSEYINQKRVEHALEIIKSRTRAGVSLKDLSLECGYANQASFIRNFSKIMGMTPGEYLESAK